MKSGIKKYSLVVCLSLLSNIGFAQFRQGNLDSIKKVTEVDYQQMLKQLNITSLRSGADGNNPNAPNAVNYDESKANPYPVLPNALKLNNGKIVKDAKTWNNLRRPELIKIFDEEIYGITPKNTPKVNWKTTSTVEGTNEEIAIVTRKMVGEVDNSSFPSIKVAIDLTITLPKKTSSKVPVILDLSFGFPPNMNNQNAVNWQKDILAKGWGIATLIPTSIQKDYGAGLREGIIGLMNKGEYRKPNDWGALKAWAWGASRILDYFETDPLIDANKIAISGHSRYGKAALVTMAYDTRFAIGYISSSGEGGAKLHRRNYGEIVENVAASGEYHWMAGNFIKYAGPLNWDDLPIDAHELIALSAPRPLFIGNGSKGDNWADPKGMFLATVAAGPVYKLLGKNDLGTKEFPEVETGLTNGDLAYRQHSGGHSPIPNWPYFLIFASKYFQ